MKTPRITDFDPDAKARSLKSSLDNMPVIKKPKRTQQPHSMRSSTTVEQHEENTKIIYRPPDEATGEPHSDQEPRRGDRPTGKGVLVRRGFEWREDQLRALKKLSIKEQLEGRSGSMSQMVRDALDEYLQKRASEI